TLSEFVTYFTKTIKLRIGKFQKVQLQQGKQIAKLNLLRKCGLLAHTSAAFLKNCCTEKLLFACGSFPAANSIIPFHHKKTAIETSSVSMTVFHRRFCSY
ncbi:MAG: hypothetical protein UGF38_01260, partial [Ruminococcus sp.]|nr:hypothetical protein [Ruminococcus sp.]